MMKSVRFALLMVLALSVFAVPSFADQSDDPAQGVWEDVFSRDPYEAEAARAGESSVEVLVADSIFADVFGRDPYDAEAARAGESSVEVVVADSTADSVFADLFGRDPYDAEAAIAELPSVEIDSSAAVRAIFEDVFGRDPYELFQYDNCSVC